MPAKKQLKFFSNHTLIVLYLVRNPRATYREIGRALGMTERHAVRMVRDLEASSVLRYKREGNNNVYSIEMDAVLPDTRMSRVSVREMMAILNRLAGDSPAASR